MSAPPVLDDAQLARVRDLLRLGKKVAYISTHLNVARTHVIEAGFGAGLRYDAHTDIMTARPLALDVDENAPTPLPESASPSQPLPPRLLPPQPRASAETIAPAPSNELEKPDTAESEKPTRNGHHFNRAALDKAAATNRARIAEYRERVDRLGGPEHIRMWAFTNGRPLRLGMIPRAVLDAYENRDTQPATTSEPATTDDTPPTDPAITAAATRLRDVRDQLRQAIAHADDLRRAEATLTDDLIDLLIHANERKTA